MSVPTNGQPNPRWDPPGGNPCVSHGRRLSDTGRVVTVVIDGRHNCVATPVGGEDRDVSRCRRPLPHSPPVRTPSPGRVCRGKCWWVSTRSSLGSCTFLHGSWEGPGGSHLGRSGLTVHSGAVGRPVAVAGPTCVEGGKAVPPTV